MVDFCACALKLPFHQFVRKNDRRVCFGNVFMLICLNYTVFYAEVFDESISIDRRACYEFNNKTITYVNQKYKQNWKALSSYMSTVLKSTKHLHEHTTYLLNLHIYKSTKLLHEHTTYLLINGMHINCVPRCVKKPDIVKEILMFALWPLESN